MSTAVAITGNWEGIGRTRLVAELGQAYAARGRRVLVIDADGDGDLAKALGVPPSHSEFTVGLCDVVYSRIPGYLVVEPTPVPGLSLLPPGDHMPHLLDAYENREEELLQDARHAMSVLRDRYDLILIDTPATPAEAGTIVANATADLRLELVPKGRSVDFRNFEAMAEFVKVQESLNPSIQMAGFLIVNELPGTTTSKSTLAARALARLDRLASSKATRLNS